MHLGMLYKYRGAFLFKTIKNIIYILTNMYISDTLIITSHKIKKRRFFMKKKNEQSSCPFADRLGKVGGQAVLEGVMMKAGNRTVTTCRKGLMHTSPAA